MKTKTQKILERLNDIVIGFAIGAIFTILLYNIL